MRILLTGSAGFIAGHVIAAIKGTHSDAAIVGLERFSGPTEAVDAVIVADLSSVHHLSDQLGADRFDACVHLAGVTGTDATSLFLNNVEGTANLVAALGSRRLAPRLVLVSSSSVYGSVPASGDADEETPLAPASAYGESCVAREMAARLFARDHDIELVTLRLFNLVGPGQRETMLVPAIARQIARIESGLQSELTVGRLDTARDYVDVRDAATAIASVALSTSSLPPILNIGSGECWSGQQVLTLLTCMTAAGLKVTVHEDRNRAGDVLRSRNSSSLARTRIPWAPRFTLGESLRDTLAQWRSRVKAEQARTDQAARVVP